MAVEECSNCGLERRVKARIAGGRALCGKCHGRPLGTCCRCGAEGRWQRPRISTGPVCDSCRRLLWPERPCGKCGRVRSIRIRATATTPDLCGTCSRGLLVACSECRRERPCTGAGSGTPLCQKCKPRPSRQCSRCGAHKPAHVAWPTGPVCVHCYHRTVDSPRPCTQCKVSRPLVGMSDAGMEICGPCAGAAHLTYECRTCGRSGNLYQKKRCSRCVLKERILRATTRPDGQVNKQLRPFAEAMGQIDRPRGGLLWLQGKGTPILQALVTSEDPITHTMLDQFPPSGTVDYLRSALIDVGVLPARDERLERIGPWLDALLAAEPDSRARLIQTYARWDVLPRARSRALQPISQSSSTYLHTKIKMALAFLTWLDGRGIVLHSITQVDVDRWLTGGARQRTELRGFLLWARRRQLINDDVTLNCRRPTVPAIDFGALDEGKRWAQLYQCLHDREMSLDLRVAGALLLLFGNQLSRTVRLTAEHIRHHDEQCHLLLDQHPILLPPVLADLITHLRDQAVPRSPISRTVTSTKWLFPGKRPGDHLRAQQLVNRLNAHGIQARQARNAAL
jgi:hypothetical protein